MMDWKSTSVCFSPLVHLKYMHLFAKTLTLSSSILNMEVDKKFYLSILSPWWPDRGTFIDIHVINLERPNSSLGGPVHDCWFCQRSEVWDIIWGKINAWTEVMKTWFEACLIETTKTSTVQLSSTDHVWYPNIHWILFNTTHWCELRPLWAIRYANFSQSFAM